MVAGVHPSRAVVGVPELPYGGGRLQGVIDHEPPARVVQLLDHLQSQVAPVEEGEGGEEELGPDDARCDVGAVRSCELVKEVINDGVQGLGGYDAQVEGEDVGDLEAAGVGLPVEEGLIEGSTLVR